jgi:UDP-N-acetylglucosamine transferase subunit ALG13
VGGAKEILSKRAGVRTAVMIFVTVGTHEQPFDRLVKEVDRLVEKGLITEPVFMQIGYSLYQPRMCEYTKFLKFNDMVDRMAKARVIITHAGPSSIMLALYKGKIPIVMPRQKEYGEHVDNHQMNFCSKLKDIGRIIAAFNSDDLAEKIQNYDEDVRNLGSPLDKSLGLEKRIEKFTEEIEEICHQLLKHKTRAGLSDQ